MIERVDRKIIKGSKLPPDGGLIEGAPIKMKKITVFIISLVLILGFSPSGFTQSQTTGIIFEDDFDADIGWTATVHGSPQINGAPSKWTGYNSESGGSMDIIGGIGYDDSAALRLGYRITQDMANAQSLNKHLTGSQYTGYSELYVRYRVKFDNTWRYGDGCQDTLRGNSCQAWKWGRLKQNINPKDTSTWSSNYVDGNNGQNAQELVWILREPTAGEGGLQVPCWSIFSEANWHLAPNYDGIDVEHKSDTRSDRGVDVTYPAYAAPTSGRGLFWSDIPEWEFDTNTGYFKCYPNCNQSYHTIEFHFKLNDMTSQPGNGDFTVWHDGIEQAVPREARDYNTGASEHGQPPLPNPCKGDSCWKTIPTRALINLTTPGGGMNFLTVFDNIRSVVFTWDTQKYIYIDDVVISTSYIGHDYEVGSSDTTPPNPPTGLRVE